MSSQKRSRETSEPQRDIAASVQAARGPELKEMLTNCKFNMSPFEKKTVHREKEFVRAFLESIDMTFAEFCELSVPAQRATAAASDYEPPNGSVAYFEDRDNRAMDVDDDHDSSQGASRDNGGSSAAAPASASDAGKEEKPYQQSSPAKASAPASTEQTHERQKRAAASRPAGFYEDEEEDEDHSFVNDLFMDFGLDTDEAGQVEREGKQGKARPPKFTDAELAWIIEDVHANAPKKVKVHAAKRGRYGATAAADAIREGRLKLDAATKKHFDADPSYKRHWQTVAKRFTAAVAAASKRLKDLRVFGQFHFPEKVWVMLDSFSQAEGASSYGSEAAHKDTPQSLASSSKHDREKQIDTAAALRKSKEQEREDAFKALQEERTLTKKLLEGVSSLIQAEAQANAGAGARAPAVAPPAGPPAVAAAVAVAAPKPAITSKYADIKALLKACGCEEYLATFQRAKMQLRQLPRLSRNELMKELNLPLGPAMAIEEEAEKFAAS